MLVAAVEMISVSESSNSLMRLNAGEVEAVVSGVVAGGVVGGLWAGVVVVVGGAEVLAFVICMVVDGVLVVIGLVTDTSVVVIDAVVLDKDSSELS